MRKWILVLMAAMLVAAACMAAAPARAQSAAQPAQARASVYEPLVGNWYHGKMWFRVNVPYNGVYRVKWSNGPGSSFHYKIMQRADGVYYEVLNHRNTYAVSANGNSVWVHYRTTTKHWVTLRFLRVE